MMLLDNVIPLTDGRVAVPANRWDLVATYPADPPTVAVVVPYFNQQRQLDLVLKALALQTYPRHLMHVVIADDGSVEAPEIGRSDLRTTVVRQDDLGFRAAAARNLGAAAATATVLCFLDADTVPEPAYLREITRLPAQLPDALVVGRRRHADLEMVTPDELDAWWAGDIAPQLLSEPGWLSAEYAASGDLLRIDHRSYRYIISSVMCCSAALFEAIGGFDESFGSYGGEDWEFAHRAVAGGAVLHHCRAAVAWHDGPDWGERDIRGRVAAKNAEALSLAPLITDPDARRAGLRYALPDIAVHLDSSGHTAASLINTIGSFLTHDVGVWVDGDPAAGLLREIGAADDRVHLGAPPRRVLGRCRFVVTTEGRPVLSDFGALVAACAQPGVGAVTAGTPGAAVTCRSSWAVNRLHRWSTGDVRFADPADASRIAGAITVPADRIGLRCAEPEPDLSW